MRLLQKAIARVVLALGLAALTVGCAPQNPQTTNAPARTSYQVVSQALLDLSKDLGTLQTAVINGNQSGLIPTATTNNILDIAIKIAQAGKQATAITAGLNALGPTNKTTLASIFTPILASVNESLTSGLITIKDPNTLNSVKSVLTLIQGTLTVVQVSLQGGN